MARHSLPKPVVNPLDCDWIQCRVEQQAVLCQRAERHEKKKADLVEETHDDYTSFKIFSYTKPLTFLLQHVCNKIFILSKTIKRKLSTSCEGEL
jgi:hypothetical protein